MMFFVGVIKCNPSILIVLVVSYACILVVLFLIFILSLSLLEYLRIELLLCYVTDIGHQ